PMVLRSIDASRYPGNRSGLTWNEYPVPEVTKAERVSESPSTDGVVQAPKATIALSKPRLFSPAIVALGAWTTPSVDGLSETNFFERLDPGEQKRFFEESYKLFSERYGKQNIAYATVHNDEQTP